LIRSVHLHSRHLVQRFGLTGPQLTALRTLHGAGELSGADLARAVRLSPATVTGILRRLEHRGLVSRRPGRSDRRQVKFSVTPACREVLEQEPSLLSDMFLERLSQLEDWEQTQLLASLQRLASMMEGRSTGRGETAAEPAGEAPPAEVSPLRARSS
jgi:DNA-binding MarR family transcriptional regulator